MRRTIALLAVLAILTMTGCTLFNPASAVLYHETFTGETASQWSESESDTSKQWIEGGEYHVQYKLSEAKQYAYFNNDQGPFNAFQLEVDVRHISGESNLTAVGIVFRLEDWDNYYGFRISPAGTYYIWKEVGGTWTTLVGWTASSAINEDAAANHLMVIADGTTLVFQINGQEVDQVVDNSFSSGYIGIYSRTYDGSTNVHLTYDDIIVTEL